MSKKKNTYYIDADDVGNPVVRLMDSGKYEDKIVSDKDTEFIICSERCITKEHFGYFIDNLFYCTFLGIDYMIKKINKIHEQWKKDWKEQEEILKKIWPPTGGRGS